MKDYIVPGIVLISDVKHFFLKAQATGGDFQISCAAGTFPQSCPEARGRDFAVHCDGDAIFDMVFFLNIPNCAGDTELLNQCRVESLSGNSVFANCGLLALDDCGSDGCAVAIACTLQSGTCSPGDTVVMSCPTVSDCSTQAEPD